MKIRTFERGNKKVIFLTGSKAELVALKLLMKTYSENLSHVGYIDFIPTDKPIRTHLLVGSDEEMNTDQCYQCSERNTCFAYKLIKKYESLPDKKTPKKQTTKYYKIEIEGD